MGLQARVALKKRETVLRKQNKYATQVLKMIRGVCVVVVGALEQG